MGTISGLRSIVNTRPCAYIFYTSSFWHRCWGLVTEFLISLILLNQTVCVLRFFFCNLFFFILVALDLHNFSLVHTNQVLMIADPTQTLMDYLIPTLGESNTIRLSYLLKGVIFDFKHGFLHMLENNLFNGIAP